MATLGSTVTLLSTLIPIIMVSWIASMGCVQRPLIARINRVSEPYLTPAHNPPAQTTDTAVSKNNDKRASQARV